MWSLVRTMRDRHNKCLISTALILIMLLKMMWLFSSKLLWVMDIPLHFPIFRLFLEASIWCVTIDWLHVSLTDFGLLQACASRKKKKIKCCIKLRKMQTKMFLKLRYAYEDQVLFRTEFLGCIMHFCIIGDCDIWTLFWETGQFTTEKLQNLGHSSDVIINDW